MIQNNTLIAQLMDVLQEIAQITNYPSYFNTERCLAEPLTYINLCKYIFPELRLQISQIQLDAHTYPLESLVDLLELLSDVLTIDLSKIEPHEIMRFNIYHIQSFVAILHEYSKMIKANSGQMEIRSLYQSSSNSREIENENKPQSARDQVKRDRIREDLPPESRDFKKNQIRVQPNQHSEQSGEHIPLNPPQKHTAQKQPKDKDKEDVRNENNQIVQKPKEPKKKGKAQKGNNQPKPRGENLHQNIVNTIMNQKTRMLQARERDNRKNKLQEVEGAKEQYRAFLKSYIKQDKATKRREQKLAKRAHSAVKPLKQELPLQDFDKIEDFFQSFAYRFRDKKAAYVRKLSQIIHKQEIDRYCYQNRIERETKQFMERQLGQQLQAASHQHRVKSELVKETAKNMQNDVTIMKKEERKLASSQRKELKQAKKQELKRIENVLSSDNERVLMALEDGGRLEQIILKMYKRL